MEGKKDTSYTYWVRARNDNLYDMRPTKVDKASPVAEDNKAVSAWNSAGTWEDRALKAEHLDRALSSFWDQAEAKRDIEARVGSRLQARVVRGEGSLITVRGKRKLGYEITVEISSQQEKLVLADLADDEDDCVNATGSRELARHRVALVKAVKEALENFRLSLT